MNRKLKLEELNRLSVKEFKDIEKFPISVILDDVRSLNNVGSMFRTADAFKIRHIYLCGITAQPPHRDITKTAIGATESVNWSYHESVEELIQKLKKEGEKVYAIEQTEHSTTLESVNFTHSEKITFVFGNEVEGVSQKAINICESAVEIPQFGTKHSLNISVCCGIVLWEAIKKYI